MEELPEKPLKESEPEHTDRCVPLAPLSDDLEMKRLKKLWDGLEPDRQNALNEREVENDRGDIR